MTLREYLREEKLSVQTFADRIRVHNTTVYRWLEGRGMRVNDMKRIIEGSEGKITADDLLKANGRRKRAA